jgi:hypothetical protein
VTTNRRRPSRERHLLSRLPGALEESPPLALPPWWALALVAAWGALVVLAPPNSTWVWGVNGFRSVPWATRAVLLLAAAGAAALAALPRRSRAFWWALALVVAVAIAFPLHERAHALS